MILLAAGFFIRSTDTAHAEPGPENFFQQGTNKIGKYMIITVGSYSNVLLVWDTETGKNQSYIYYDQTGKCEKYSANLPEKPVE